MLELKKSVLLAIWDMFSIKLVLFALLLSLIAQYTKTESVQFVLKGSSFKTIPASDSLQNVSKLTAMDFVLHANKVSQFLADFVYKTSFYQLATHLSSCQLIMLVLMGTLFIAQNICLLQANAHHAIPITHLTAKTSVFSLVLLTQTLKNTSKLIVDAYWLTFIV